MAVLDFKVDQSAGVHCLGPMTAYQKMALGLLSPLVYFAQLWVIAVLHIIAIRLKLFARLKKFDLNVYIRSTVAILLFSYSSVCDSELPALLLFVLFSHVAFFLRLRSQLCSPTCTAWTWASIKSC